MQQPQQTLDLFNNYGTDLVYGAMNDLQTVSDVLKSQQRVTRRLLTSPGAYIWHTDYGAGLPVYVGKALTNALYTEIQSVITSQIFLEDSVAQNPTPVITLQTVQGGLLVQINYTVNPIGTPIVLTFLVEQ
jgi:phage baseplate assembly protein W